MINSHIRIDSAMPLVVICPREIMGCAQKTFTTMFFLKVNAKKTQINIQEKRQGREAIACQM